MKKVVLISFALVLAFALVGCGSSKPSGSSASSSAQAQVFDSDVATVTYRDAVEPTQGNIMLNFALENKTGSAVMVSGENIVVNGEYSVQALGGSATPIESGTTGSVSVVFGYSVQTPLKTMGDIKSMTCDLVMRDNDSLTTVVGSVPVSVEVR